MTNLALIFSHRSLSPFLNKESGKHGDSVKKTDKQTREEMKERKVGEIDEGG